MKIEILPDAKAVAKRAAALIAAESRDAVVANGQFSFAVSGGKTPWIMLKALAGEKVPWEEVHLFQVDERVAPAGDPDRNLTHLQDSLLSRVPLPAENVHPMPVESPDLGLAARDYANALEKVAGAPPVLDLVHLGLGADGHTASLIPGDPVLNNVSADVDVTGEYMGRRRMTLTYPVLNRARKIIFVVTGADKVEALAKLRGGDVEIPAGRVSKENALIIADESAAGGG